MRRILGILTSLILVFSCAIYPTRAAVNNQITSAVDWNGFSLSSNSGLTQSIKPLYVPSPSQAQVDWSLNVGNSSSRLSPTVVISNTNAVYFGFFDVASDARFTQIANTRCSVYQPNAFGESNSSQARCSTPLEIVAGETYIVSITPDTFGKTSSWKGELVVQSTNQRLNLGVLTFTSAASTLNFSNSMNGFNQTSIYGDDLTCKSAPRADVVYSRPQPVGSGSPIYYVNSRSSSNCSEFGFTNNSDGSVTAKLGNSTPTTSTPSDLQYHTGANYTLDFVPTKLDLNGNLEIDFTPLSINTAGLGSKYESHYGFDWCWQTKETLKGTQSCGSLHIELYAESGSGFDANIDFFFQNGSSVSKLDNGMNCELRQQGSIVGETSFYSTCYRRVVIQPNRTYTLSVYADKAKGDNWWRARITDKAASTSLEVGSIKGAGNLYGLSLASMWISGAYIGKPVSCDAVPIHDVIYSPIRNGSDDLAIVKGTRSGNCVRFSGGRLKSDPSQFLIGFGGAGSSPKDRNLSLFSTEPLLSGSSSTNTNSNTSQSTSTNSSSSNKPSKPSLTSLNIVGNQVNIDVNLGSGSSPDNIYVVAPGLSIDGSEKFFGKINGSKATWSLPVSAALSGKLIPLKFVSTRQGVDSDPLISELQVPIIQAPAASQVVPKKPSNLRSNFIGTDLVLTAQIEVSGNAVPTRAYLLAPQLGITKAKPALGEFVGNKVVFSLPVNSKNFGQLITYDIYTKNSAGVSPSARATAKLPKLSGVGTPPKTPPMNTITCTRGTVLRTFAATKCPPGWNTK